jgi:hypothetical protein
VDKPPADVACGAPSAQCWDVAAMFQKTDFENTAYAPQIFGQAVADNQKAYALLDGAQDDSYEQHPIACGGTRAESWDIERKLVSATSYRILVRGGSAPDCGKGQPVSAGSVEVNAARGWKIAQAVRCDASADNSGWGVTIPTYCTVDKLQGTISWQAGSTCTGCCACPDGAGVDIEVVVSK